MSARCECSMGAGKVDEELESNESKEGAQEKRS